MSRNLDDLFLSGIPDLDEEARDIINLTRQWAHKEIVSRRMEYNQRYDELFGRQWAKLSDDLGITRITRETASGGFGWSTPAKAPHLLGVAMEMGRADASLGMLAVSSWIVPFIFDDTDGLPERSGSLSGGSAVTAFILPGSGLVGEAAPLFMGRALRASLKKAAGGFVLTGKDLRPLWSGGIADVYCVVAADDGGAPCVVAVTRGSQGVALGPVLKTTGLNACANADVGFDETPVPGNLAAFGPTSFLRLSVWISLLSSGVSVGAAMNFFEMLADWAETRTIKGGTILKENPLCASVLAEAAQEIALARMLLFGLASIVAWDNALEASCIERTHTYAGMVCGRVMEGLVRSTNRGLELMGSAGYAKEWHVEKHWRDIKTVQSALSGVASTVPAAMDAARFFYGCTQV